MSGNSSQKPLVSAVVPTYNRRQVTERAVMSVAKQTYDPVELILVDDGSEPAMETHISLSQLNVEQSRLLRHPVNRGANAARNTGIAEAQGKYVAFLDADDEWKPRKIERQIRRLETSQSATASYTRIEQRDPEGAINATSQATASGRLRDVLLEGNAIGTFSSVVVERSMIERAGLPDPDLPCWQDWEWYLRLAGHVIFDSVDEPLTIRHTAGDQISEAYREKRERAYPVLKQVLSELADTREQERRALSHLDYHLGYAALANHRYGEARRLFWSAISRYPYNLKFFTFLFVTGPHYRAIRRLKRTLTRLVV